ncbi:MAG: ATP synthase F1 subunit delta [Mycoplasmataceae bacterium]|nr:ATP synthase F1 subunit delta [Mycoplasmataceae bacterium]
MIDNKSAYVDYLVGVATAKKRLKEYADFASKFISILDSIPLVYKVISDLGIKKQRRKLIVANVLQKNIPVDFIYLIWTIIDFNETDNIRRIFFDFRTACEEKLGISVIKIFTPFPLTKQQLSNITNSLEKAFKQKIKPLSIIDKTLIGGIKIEGKDFILDESVKFKIEQIKANKYQMEEFDEVEDE